ncbi:hypothetical protein [Bdellovibrio svalbardensis]|uniref:Uncharacterized protein n=1 Tax=Bdellovibrio svalbardensis TaxID=2972972 RepID=A0ABT6DHF2_9BACT|nr:hypothetical protein [Bdellovibrio svalbardensis]MDG0815344.1 hypothetical protein [Bdellovibrio svalbardensis]
MKFTALLFATLLGMSFTATPAQAGWDFLQPAKIIEKIRQQIAKQDIGVSIGLIDGEIFSGFSTALGYKLESEPSYIDGYYTRVDKYRLEAQVNPGDILEDNDSPIGFTIQQNTEIIFARQFKSQSDSLKAFPYTLKNLPLNAHKAIRNLQVGDFVALQAKLGIVFSVGASTEVNPALSLGGSTHVYLSGDFMIHIFRMENDKIRVKLITMRKKGVGANIDLDYARKFKIVGLRVIDRRIEKIVDLTPLSLGFGKSANDVFMLDYVFDLKNSQSSQSFDDLMSKKVRFKDLKVIDPTASRPELAEDLMTDMSGVEQIFNEDRDLPASQRRIDRIFKGSNTSLDSGSNFKLGLSIIKLKSGFLYSQNQLLNYDRNDREQKYLLDSYSRDFESKFLFGLFGDKTAQGTNVVFNATDSWAPASFVTYTGYRMVKMRSVSKRDFRHVQEEVKNTIPADQYAQIDWKNWDFSDGSFVNGYFRQQLFINPEALATLPVMSERAYKQAFIKYVTKAGEPARKGAAGRGHDSFSGWEDDYDSELMTIARSFVGVVSSLNDSTALYRHFKTLQAIPLWRERGVGFILSMIPPYRANSMVSYEMTFSSKGNEAIKFKFGTFPNEDLYKSLMYIQNIINNRSFDLRLITDENGEFKKN